MQTNGLNTRRYIATDDSLIYETCIAGRRHRETVPYHLISVKEGASGSASLKEPQFSESKRMTGYVTLLVLFFAGIPVFGSMHSDMGKVMGGVFFMTYIAGLIYWTIRSRNKELKFKKVNIGDLILLFYDRNSSDEQEANQFLREFHKKLGKYTKDRLMQFNAATSADEKQLRLSWLHEQKLITTEELDKELGKINK